MKKITKDAPGRPLVDDAGHVADRLDRKVSWFARVSNSTRDLAGSPHATIVLVVAVAVWLAVGPFVDYSRAWEMVATAGAPTVGLILILVLQHTQNRDAKATQLKLNEMIRASEGASDGLIGIEDTAEVELRRLLGDYRHHAAGEPDDHEAGSRRPNRRQGRRLADGNLADQSFVFRSPDGSRSVSAENLALFVRLSVAVDDETWLFHLRRGDYSRWFSEIIGDDEVARVAARLEGPDGPSAATSKRRIVAAIERHYPISA